MHYKMIEKYFEQSEINLGNTPEEFDYIVDEYKEAIINEICKDCIDENKIIEILDNFYKKNIFLSHFSGDHDMIEKMEYNFFEDTYEFTKNQKTYNMKLKKICKKYRLVYLEKYCKMFVKELIENVKKEYPSFCL